MPRNDIRSRTGSTYLGTDRRYIVYDNDGNVYLDNAQLVVAEMYKQRYPGWTYRERKYDPNVVGAVTSIDVGMNAEMRNWVKEQASREKVSAAEIIRRCIQAQMKRNRFYIPLFTNNRVCQ